MTSPSSSPAPTPAVEHLPTVFRRIRTGEYRVPPFQREFIWDERQVLELLESVYLGFPIGSTLLWKVENKVFKTVKEMSAGFPLVSEAYPTSFVLDGVQRLSSLNGVFNRDEVADDKRFDVFFDLDEEIFVHARDLNDKMVAIPLSTVFRPRLFLDQQRRLASLDKGDLYLERAVNILTVFQEYLLPVVTIYNRNPNDVVSIFQRINSTGVRLGVVDFMRALTWSDDFDLSAALLDLQDHFGHRGFRFDDELLLKSLGMVMGLRPLPDVLLELRGRSADDLQQGVQLLQSRLDDAVEFVSTYIGIANSDALPYEAQWLLLLRLICSNVKLEQVKIPLLSWIRTSSLTESLQGRPDHALVRMIDEIDGAVSKTGTIKPVPVHIAAEDILFKRFLKGKAMSVAFLSHLSDRGLFNHEPMLDVPYDRFLPLFDRAELSSMLDREINSARTIGNVVYLADIKPKKDGTLFELIQESFVRGDAEIIEMLDKQYIDKEFIKFVNAGLPELALRERAQKMLDGAMQI
ncbi:DUF262 domain-containing protein [Methylobacterium sp. WL19]|uniref:DUF262 domain-containing protein n=1 Tax=Methylobacterium sp. WL19 TaxID=2603896 RepID=UPI0011C70251|nr:DUF262 domain-containing protein [Methylobacterium sp. WL19]TXN29117.1 DUF262 domain-containing protein [Methylobacterium sp. WL19]